MKKGKKILSILLAASVGVTGLIGSSTVYGAQKTETKQKYVVVLDPGHGGNESGAYAVHNGKVYREEEINWKISNYTMQALRKSQDIEVHLTKTQNETLSLYSRVIAAKQYKADLLVSQHINDSESSSPNGASVMISRGTYRPEIAAKEKLFGSYVLEELGKLGIRRRFPETGGMEYRMSENGSTYPNGQARDYYGIVAQSVEQNLPGVIIEHAFISSPSDAYNFLRSDAKLKKIAQADANAIIRYCKQLPEKTSSDTGNGSGEHGWKKVNGEYYFYKNGIKQTHRLLHLKSGIYYVDKDGKRRYGWKVIDGQTYYFQKNGKAALGWMQKNGHWYFFNATSGFLYKDIMLIDGEGKIYIFDKDGKRYDGWCTYKGNKYYIDETGSAHTGWIKIKGKWYYFHKRTAVMYKNCTVQNSKGIKYTFNSKGVCTNRK